MRHLSLLLLLLLLLACCGREPHKQPEAAAVPSATSTPAAPLPEKIDESFISTSNHKADVDSIAVYDHAGEPWAVVTGKASDKLYVFNANSGELLKEVGSTGEGLGQFRRPNGILIIGDICLIVERDNHRVQALQLPDFKPLGLFGADVLRKPYGITSYPLGDDRHRLYLTDDYDAPESDEVPSGFYTERVKIFECSFSAGKLSSNWLRSFGDETGPGRLTKVESILVDQEKGRLLIANEVEPEKGIKIYDLEGVFTGESVSSIRFGGDPEGIGLWRSDKAGYLIFTDQQPNITVFYLLERESLKLVGSFHGPKTTNTDGIALSSAKLGSWEKGGLWAIHDDQSLVGFKWEQIQARFKL